METPSYVGEASAVIAVIDFIYWITTKTPEWTLYVWIIFGIIFIIDWMFGGIADTGICKKCFG